MIKKWTSRIDGEFDIPSMQVCEAITAIRQEAEIAELRAELEAWKWANLMGHANDK